jgi:hypothetical protein
MPAGISVWNVSAATYIINTLILFLTYWVHNGFMYSPPLRYSNICRSKHALEDEQALDFGTSIKDCYCNHLRTAHRLCRMEVQSHSQTIRTHSSIFCILVLSSTASTTEAFELSRGPCYSFKDCMKAQSIHCEPDVRQ